MLKLAIAGAIGAALFAVGRTTHSSLQLQVPSGSAIKVTPDPSNVWSWHETITLGPNETQKNAAVMVDFDRNGKLDTEIAAARVMVTDMQVSLPNNDALNTFYASQLRVTLRDSTGERWDLLPSAPGESASRWRVGGYSTHLRTPLVLEVGSGLEVAVTGVPTQSCTVHLIGRLNTL